MQIRCYDVGSVVRTDFFTSSLKFYFSFHNDYVAGNPDIKIFSTLRAPDYIRIRSHTLCIVDTY